MAQRKRLPSRKSVYEVLADAVNVECPNEVMIVDRGLLRWAMVMTRAEPSGPIVPPAKQPTVVAPLRRYRIKKPRPRTTQRL